MLKPRLLFLIFGGGSWVLGVFCGGGEGGEGGLFGFVCLF